MGSGAISGIYEQHVPHKSHHFQFTQDHFDELEMIWDERYQPKYGFWRPYVTDVIYRYLDCGNLKKRFCQNKMQ